MADDRLVAGLSAWLHDSDTPAPDALMSASRVMAGVEVTPRLGRFWPPTRLAPKAEPAPALGAFGPDGPPARPVPRVQKPAIKARLRRTLTRVRLLAIGCVAALVLSLGLWALSYLNLGVVVDGLDAVVTLERGQLRCMRDDSLAFIMDVFTENASPELMKGVHFTNPTVILPLEIFLSKRTLASVLLILV